ncbi:MAG: hypothetical protein ACMX3H_00260 [Sodalis sp. (in: enterobacteria)]
MEHILTGPYNKPTNNSRRPPRGAYGGTPGTHWRQPESAAGRPGDGRRVA